jgi:HEAT repeat protein
VTAESIANHRLPAPVAALAPLLDDTDTGVRRAAAHALALAGDPGMLALVSHAHLPEVRAALWVWAERRQWSFPPAPVRGE